MSRLSTYPLPVNAEPVGQCRMVRTAKDLPCPVTERRQVEGVGDFRGRHGSTHVLLVGPYEDRRPRQVLIGSDAMQLCAGERYTLPVVAVHDKDQLGVSRGRSTYCISRSQVLRPACTQRCLPAYIPEHKLEVLIFKRFCGMSTLHTAVPVLDPIVGAVATTDPSVILYISVVLPALSRLL